MPPKNAKKWLAPVRAGGKSRSKEVLTMRRLAIASCIVLLAVSMASAATWVVPSDDCPTIQAAVDLAVADDVVEISDGLYTDVGNYSIDITSAITVRSQSGNPYACVIDCEGNGRCFYVHCAEEPGVVIEGIKIINGIAEGEYYSYGGGIYNASVTPLTVTNCVFEDCSAIGTNTGIGGAIYAAPLVSYCVFTGNQATATSPTAGSGAGGALADVTNVANCTFTGNSAFGPLYGDGGAIIDCWTVTDCVFSGNSASYMGGAAGTNYTTMDLTRCTFYGNWAPHGGAVASSNEIAWCNVTFCTFFDNTADTGGGVNIFAAGGSVTSSTFYSNYATNGGAIAYEYGFGSIWLCTLYGNGAQCGGGIYLTQGYSDDIQKTIVASSTSGGAICCSGPNTFPVLTCCDLYENVGGDWEGCIAGQLNLRGNFSECPSFCNAQMADFDLCDQSPCLPGNHPYGYDCPGGVGAHGQRCYCGPTQTETTDWGAIKAIYR
jgi:hypothetical protein